MTSSSSDSHALAQAVHDLGAALWFGGAVMGVAGVNKSGEDLRDGLDKIRVASSAWNRYAPAQWAGIGAVVLAGAQLTATSKARLAGQQGYGRVGAKKIQVVLTGAAATAYAAYTGAKIAHAAEEAHRRGETVDVENASEPNSRTPQEVALWQRRQRLAQYAVVLTSGANVVLNAYLAQRFRPGATVKGFVQGLT